MKIKNLVATNFKGNDILKFNPTKKIVAYVGKNGAGKTSVQEAIQAALTGVFPDNPIKAGKPAVTVSCELDDGTRFTRKKDTTGTTKVTLNDRMTTQKNLTETIERNTGVLMEALKLSTSANAITNMKPEEFSDFLFRYIPQEITAKEIEGYLGTKDPDIITMLNDNLPKGKFRSDAITHAYDDLMELRKKYNKEIKMKEAIIASVPYDKPKYTIEDVDKALEKIIKDQGSAEGLALAIKTYNNAVEAKKKQEEEIARLEAEVKKLDSVKAPNPSAINKTKEQIKDINQDIINAKTTIASIQDTINVLTETIKRLNSAFCPLSERIECKSQAERVSLKDDFEEEIKAQKESIDFQNKIIAEKQTKLTKLNEELDSYSKQEIQYNKKLVMVDNVNKLKASVITLPIKPKATEVDPVDYEAEKKKWNDIRERIDGFERKVKAQDDAKKLASKHAAADYLVKALAPKGHVMRNLMEYYIGAVEASFNDTIKALNPNYEVKLVADNGVKVKVKTDSTKEFIPYESASSGERAYVILGLMDLISVGLAQANIMILDDLDKLDKDAFDALIDLICTEEIQDMYDHIIIAAVNHEDTVATLKAHSEIELNEI